MRTVYIPMSTTHILNTISAMHLFPSEVIIILNIHHHDHSAMNFPAKLGDVETIVIQWWAFCQARWQVHTKHIKILNSAMNLCPSEVRTLLYIHDHSAMNFSAKRGGKYKTLIQRWAFCQARWQVLTKHIKILNSAMNLA